MKRDEAEDDDGELGRAARRARTEPDGRLAAAVELAIDTDDPAWNAPGFTGSVLRLSDFPTGDPVEVAADFYRRSRDRATG